MVFYLIITLKNRNIWLLPERDDKLVLLSFFYKPTPSASSCVLMLNSKPFGKLCRGLLPTSATVSVSFDLRKIIDIFYSKTLILVDFLKMKIIL